MTLVFLVLVLVTPYALLTLIQRLVPNADIPPRRRAKVGLTLLLLITASAHFARPEAMAEMLPPAAPFRVGLVYLTGGLEVMAAVGIHVPAVAERVGTALAVMLVLFLPANVYAAFHHVPFGGHGGGPLYLLVRVPFQILVIAWSWMATREAAGPDRRPEARREARGGSSSGLRGVTRVGDGAAPPSSA